MTTNVPTGLLNAVSAGRVQCSAGCEPDFFIDGLACCDHFQARTLVRDGLVRPVPAEQDGDRIPVELTSQGRAALAH